MQNYIDILRCIVKNFNIHINHEFDEIIKRVLNEIFDQYYDLRNKIFDDNNYKENSYCIDGLYKKYNIRKCKLERKYKIINNESLIVKFKKLDCDNFQIFLNIVNMDNYIDVLRCILKNFNIRKIKKFDTIIKYIMNIFIIDIKANIA